MLQTSAQPSHQQPTCLGIGTFTWGPAAILLTGGEKAKSFLISLSPYFKELQKCSGICQNKVLLLKVYRWNYLSWFSPVSTRVDKSNLLSHLVGEKKSNLLNFTTFGQGNYPPVSAVSGILLWSVSVRHRQLVKISALDCCIAFPPDKNKLLAKTCALLGFSYVYIFCVKHVAAI